VYAFLSEEELGGENGNGGKPLVADRLRLQSFAKVRILLLPLMAVAFALDRLRIHPAVAISLYRPLHMAILLAMAILLLIKRRIRVFELTPTVLCLVMFNLAVILTLAFAYDPSASFSTVLTLGEISVAALLTGLFLVNFWDIRYMGLLAKALGCVAVISASTLITDYLGLTSFKSIYLDREVVRQFGILGEPNFAAGKLGIGFPFVAWAFFKAVSARRTILAVTYAICCGLLAIAILLTGSRMGAFMLAISLAFVAVKEWKLLFMPKTVLIGGFLVAALFLLLTGPLSTMFDLIIQRTEPILQFIGTGGGLGERSAAKRVELLSAGWELFRDHPVFGVGIGGYRLVLPLYRPHLGSVYAHNTYVEILTGTGLVGFLPFTALLLSIARRMWQGWRKERESRLPFYFALSFVMVAIHLFFLSDYSNRYLWGLFLPLSIYLEWYHARHFARRDVCKSQ